MLTYALLRSAEAALSADALHDLYAEVYAEPPYNEGDEFVARFVGHYADALVRDGLALARACDDDGTLAGAAYGWTMPAGKWFSSQTADPPAEVLAQPKFALMEWMVRRKYRGRGVGRRLLDLVLTGRHEPYAILASNPDAAARRIYEHYGWQVYGHTAGGFMPPMDILGRPLR